MEDKISTHTPAWGVTRTVQGFQPCFLYFNSHARVGRDFFALWRLALLVISTHTPAWGVTLYVTWRFPYKGISTHTPAWGVTPSHLSPCPMQMHFNSHARVGRDNFLQRLVMTSNKFQLTRPRGA